MSPFGCGDGGGAGDDGYDDRGVGGGDDDDDNGAGWVEASIHQRRDGPIDHSVDWSIAL